MSLSDAADRVGVTRATLRRWIGQGLIPQYDGEWTPAAIGQARVVAKMRQRGHSLTQIRTATEEGRLALGFLEELFPTEPQRYSFKHAARETGVDEGLIKRLIAGLGVNPETADTVSEDELQMLRYVAAVLDSGFPLVALLQLVRVYGQAMARIAVHYGVALYRDGDYFGRDINIASRVAARSAGGEVLVTRPVVEVARVGGNHLDFERIGEVTLKGFSESTEVFAARPRGEEEAE